MHVFFFVCLFSLGARKGNSLIFLVVVIHKRIDKTTKE
jgi:hypothetical protein